MTERGRSSGRDPEDSQPVRRLYLAEILGGPNNEPRSERAHAQSANVLRVLLSGLALLMSSALVAPEVLGRRSMQAP